MAPVTRSQHILAQGMQEQHAQESASDTDSNADSSSLASGEDIDDGSNDGSSFDSNDSDSDSDSDSSSSSSSGPVRSSLTGLLYAVDRLDDDAQDMVRDLFRPLPPEETPPLTVEWCGRVANDPDVLAFQLHERVPRAIRIGAPTSRIPRPTCNCTAAAVGEEERQRPCRHLVWLLDQIAQQTLPRHPPGRPLVLNARGVPVPFGDASLDEDAGVYARIRAFRIDLLANGLHCRAGPPTAGAGSCHRHRHSHSHSHSRRSHRRHQYSWPDRHRVREVREILAGLAGVQEADEVDGYAPDVLEEEEEGGPVRNILAPGDLPRTLARLLLANGTFFALFLRLLAPHDAARDPFRKIEQRVEGVLAAVDRQQRSVDDDDVAWAAQHITDAAAQIRLLVEHHIDSANDAAWARQSAARALVWILQAVVAHHADPLYQRLIGDGDSSFALLDALALCVPPPVSSTAPSTPPPSWLHRRLARVRRRVHRHGCREAFLRQLDGVLERVRQAEAAAEAVAASAPPVVARFSSSSCPPSSPSSSFSSRASSPTPASGRKRRSADMGSGSGQGLKRARGQ